ncbi:hypothetical protein DEBA109399_12765 [Dermacoccus barathri]
MSSTFAGELGQQVLHAWRSAGFVTRDWQLTSTGREWAWANGLGLEGRRALVRPRVDWTERVDHAAGIFPDEFAGSAFESALVTRGSHERSAVLTDAGGSQRGAERTERSKSGTGRTVDDSCPYCGHALAAATSRLRGRMVESYDEVCHRHAAGPRRCAPAQSRDHVGAHPCVADVSGDRPRGRRGRPATASAARRTAASWCGPRDRGCGSDT